MMMFLAERSRNSRTKSAVAVFHKKCRRVGALISNEAANIAYYWLVRKVINLTMLNWELG
jgi:hypothetical protein